MENQGSVHDLFHFQKGRFIPFQAKRHLMSLFFDAIGFSLSLLLVFMGYSYGKKASHTTTLTKVEPQQIALLDFSTNGEIVPTIALPTTESRCGPSLVFYETSDFSVCIPSSLREVSEPRDTSHHFLAQEEELIIEPNSAREWPIHLCNFNADTTVSSYPAVRTTFRKETGAGCDEIVGFATKIDSSTAAPFYIGLTKNSGYFTNSEVFEKIEQSLVLH